MSGLQLFISSSMRACAKTVSWKVTFPVTSLCTSRDVSTKISQGEADSKRNIL